MIFDNIEKKKTKYFNVSFSLNIEAINQASLIIFVPVVLVLLLTSQSPIKTE